MLIDLQEAKDCLRIDGEEFNSILYPLLESIPSYLEATTGRTWEDETVHPLAQTAAKFILQLWFDPQGHDSERLKRTIDNLLTALTAIGRTMP